MRTLSVTDNDLDFTIADGIESVMQRVVQRLKWWRGEWFLAVTGGLPYLPTILGEGVELRAVERLITGTIESVTGVVRVEDISITLDTTKRSLSYSADVITDYGNAPIVARFEPEGAVVTA